jgi:hypothetical protein
MQTAGGVGSRNWELAEQAFWRRKNTGAQGRADSAGPTQAH